MRYIYTVLFYLSLPAILARLLWRSRKNPAYLSDWQQRFALFKQPVPQQCIWLHAVSVGESLAAIPLIKKIKAAYPSIPILVTNTTPTGADRIRLSLGKDVTQVYFPYDLPIILKKFLKQIRPKILILMETELWPNLFHQCGLHNIPIFMANTRLSERSARGYKKIAGLVRPMLKNVSLMAIQTIAEADRFKTLGMDPQRIQVTGSIKFDLELPDNLNIQAAQLRSQWGKDRIIWIAASTHEQEEAAILNIYKQVKNLIPQCLLVLVPRNPDRFSRVTNLCKKSGYKTVLRSEKINCQTDTEIFVGDSMGELLLFYAASDFAFVGGSLVETGGHNPLEASAIGLPVIMGPHVFNFTAICEQLQSAQAMIKVNHASELLQPVLDILQNETLRCDMGEKGRNFVQQNRGSLQKHLDLLAALIK